MGRVVLALAPVPGESGEGEMGREGPSTTAETPAPTARSIPPPTTPSPSPCMPVPPSVLYTGQGRSGNRYRGWVIWATHCRLKASRGVAAPAFLVARPSPFPPHSPLHPHPPELEAHRQGVRRRARERVKVLARLHVAVRVLVAQDGLGGRSQVHGT